MWFLGFLKLKIAANLNLMIFNKLIIQYLKIK